MAAVMQHKQIITGWGVLGFFLSALIVWHAGCSFWIPGLPNDVHHEHSQTARSFKYSTVENV